MANASTAVKNEALLAAADLLEVRSGELLTANAQDVSSAEANGIAPGLIDRLRLSPERVTAMADGLRQVATLADPVGEVMSGWVRPNGLRITQVRVPLGVVAIIYESRPNVTSDAAGLCLKSGNAAFLRGSGSAINSNLAIGEVLREAVTKAGLPTDAVIVVDDVSREAATEFMRQRGFIDVLIPRGGHSLIQSILDNATVPFVIDGDGNCHVYVDADADLDKAVAILVNAKTQRVSVCNAAETFLVHADIAADFLPRALEALRDKGVTVHGDDRMAAAAASAGIAFAPVTDDDWAAEYYSLDIAAGVVDSLDEALEHIRRWSSGHTEAIVSDSQSAVRRFVAGVDSAAVMVNASTRFTDGGEFGFGAEIGISTQKLHARGPMGLRQLTTGKYVVEGSGQVRN